MTVLYFNLIENDNIINGSGYDASLKCKIYQSQMYKFFSDLYFHWSLSSTHKKENTNHRYHILPYLERSVYASLNLLKC